MKVFFIFALAASAGMAADQPKTVKPRGVAHTANRSAKEAAKPAAEVKVPAAAVAVEPGTWKYTDEQGRKWLYRQTPFGISRVEDKPAASGAATPPTAEREQITAVADGETVKFERPGPFGTYKWERKASELNPAEKAALDRLRSAAGSARQE